jgi:hypothetical protein
MLRLFAFLDGTLELPPRGEKSRYLDLDAKLRRLARELGK